MTPQFTDAQNQQLPAGIIRRFAAIFYDAILCLALVMTITMTYMAVNHSILGAEEYRALNESGSTLRDPLLSSILFISLFLFFGYFWTKNGQTLGMQVWHLRIQNNDNTHITWNQSLIRFLVSFVSFFSFGLGYFWAIIDKQHRTWHCILSESEVIRIPKKK
jgi:uncharacterized RDD family membrane protein YckC